MQILSASAFDDQAFFLESGELRAPQRQEAGIEEGGQSLQAGLEEWIGSIDPKRWAEIHDPKRAELIQSFSGIRAKVGFQFGRPDKLGRRRFIGISNEHKLIFSDYAYGFARKQIQKFLNERVVPEEFLFVLGRDPRPSGREIREAQMRGMLKAASDLGVRLRFIEGGILPTPFVEGLVRLERAHGGAIITASHNSLKWNGVKYPTAAWEPGNRLVQGGILLPVEQMALMVERYEEWAKETMEDPGLADSRRRTFSWVDLDRGKVEKVSSREILRYMIWEARRMWSLTAPTAFREFKHKAEEVTIVLDPNGGAAAGHYRRFLKAFGFNVVEINRRFVRPKHRIEPVGKALDQANAKLQEEWRRDKEAGKIKRAYFAVVFDYDADRGNTILLDPQTGEITKPNPQEVAAMNVAMVLAREHLRWPYRDQRPTPAVVVHDATSRRVWEIARAFGAEVFLVETGEVNVLEKMRQLERQRMHRVLIGIEGANGGTVFRGDDPEFQGDTSRNGAMTALFTGMVAIFPEIGRSWLEERNRVVPDNVPKVEPIPDASTLVKLLRSLPGEQAEGDWRFVTPIWKQGKPREVPGELIVPFQQAMKRLIDRKRLAQKGLTVTGIIYTRGSQYFYASQEPPESDVYGGGWMLALKTQRGLTAFLWLRGSLTEGIMRVSVEGQGEKAESIAGFLKDLFTKEWYPAALEAAKATAGLEESLEQVTVEVAGLAVEFRPSTVRRNWVHIFDPEMAEMGLLVARIQTDPVVIIAENFDQAGWLMNEGFIGGDRRILLQGNRTIEKARDAAAALFGEFTPRLYPAEGRNQPNLWIAWVLEQYDVPGLTVQQAVEMIEEFTRRQAA